ncbi:hypothetical protein MRX96_048351 [Rhipicephalus microplus]
MVVRNVRVVCWALVQLVQCLDPGQRGLISFKDFATGVMALLGASNGHSVGILVGEGGVAAWEWRSEVLRAMPR